MSDPIKQQISDLEKKVTLLETRIAGIEKQIKDGSIHTVPANGQESEKVREQIFNSENLEFQIGQFWLAKSGIVILAIGIAFALTFPYKNFPSYLPLLIGYTLVIVLFIISYRWQNSLGHISKYFLGSALILLYFTTMRLHYFNEIQIISNGHLELVLLSVVVLFNLSLSAYKNAIFLAAISLTLGYTTAIISDSATIIFIYLTFLAAISVYFKINYGWNHLYSYAIVLTYLTHFLWFLNNPIINRQIEFVSAPAINMLFLLFYATIFAIGNLFRDKQSPESNHVIITTFINCSGLLGLLLLISLSKFPAQIFIYHLAASLIFLLFSILFWIREKSKVSTFFYAISGYSALSIAIISQFDNPDFFILLCWQSLLVISTAIWYRSKFIIVANFTIFLCIFITYLIMAGEINPASLSFVIVALTSARILNWQKDRLELKTELMRNAYLVTGFFMFPYTLFQLVPNQYVSLSWLGIALFYYTISRLIQNNKYRWMALFTLLLTVVYIMIIGITQLEPGLRILSFVVIGIVLLTTSIVYTRIKSKSSTTGVN